MRVRFDRRESSDDLEAVAGEIETVIDRKIPDPHLPAFAVDLFSVSTKLEERGSHADLDEVADTLESAAETAEGRDMIDVKRSLERIKRKVQRS